MKQKVVIDTNIIVSSLWNQGKAYDFMLNVIEGKYEVFVSDTIIEEYTDVLFRPKFHFDTDDIIYILEWFDKNAIKVSHKKSDVEMVDEKDRVLYDLAKILGAKLITGNLKHYPVDELVTPLNKII